ncbi:MULTISPECIES: flagellar filament capping protein FliD [unclassified Thioalkalivibrio]|uniref:flagellar filament capping protein FliD n=1 Tax=unclassified Thioalkalivibrio TaxID=2621013 RepID=UPI0003689BEF|nr:MULTISPECIES: flagellar filament capping protein FliD [unclassified Thioalkalivibrio]PYG03855.1 flagellar hook-associated protein 2 [Thioalkalivibrio sp. ALE21]
MAISSLGVGSGLDLNQIVGDLVNAQRAPREERLNEREERIEAEISAYGSLSSSMDGIGSALSNLADFEPEQSASLSNEDVASVVITGDAPNGDFNMDVQQLAEAQTVASDSGLFDSTDEEVGAGTFSISVGDGEAVSLDVEEGDTLNDLRNAINDADAGVRASIVNDGNGPRLTMTSESTGEQNTINVEVDGDADLDRLANLGDPETVTVEAQDALVTIDGMEITSASNTLEDTIEGMAIDLEGVGQTSVSVSEDQDELRNGLESFVEAYNTMVSETNELTAYDAEEDEAAVLTGDSTVRSARSRMSNALTERSQVEGINNQTLAELGITTQRDGTLSFDTQRFDEVMDREGFEDVSAMVRDIAGGMEETLQGITGPEGLIQTRQDGLQNEQDRVDRQRERLDDRIERLEDRLVRQFSSMDTSVAQMQQTGDFLQQRLGGGGGMGGGMI